MPEQGKGNTGKSLRIIDAELYHYVTGVFYDRQNIHPYDLEIFGTVEETGLLITIRFGEDYAHGKEAFFTHEALASRHTEFEEFLTETADECKKAMVADYFRMMKP